MKELYGSLGVVYLHSSLYLGAYLSLGYHLTLDLKGGDFPDLNIKACMLSLSIRLLVALREERAKARLKQWRLGGLFCFENEGTRGTESSYQHTA